MFIKFCSPNFISSMESKKVGQNMHCALPSVPPVCPIVLCTPCAPTLSNPMRNTLFWSLFDPPLTTVSPTPFLDWFGILILQEQGILILQIKNELGILILQEKMILILQVEKWVWDTDPRHFFGRFADCPFFLNRPVGRVPIENFFRRGCQTLSWTILVDYVTLSYSHGSPSFTKLLSNTWPLCPDTLYTIGQGKGDICLLYFINFKDFFKVKANITFVYLV